MRGFVASIIVAAVAAGSIPGHAADIPEFPKPAKEHQWLSQLVGEWDSEVEMFMPDQPPVKSTGTESVRSVGGFWTVAENKGKFGDDPFTGIMTLGYDTGKGHYVGTWVDSMTGYLWTYEGKVDDSGKTLTLTAEGPCPAAGGEMQNFKETLELKSPDHKVFTSYIQGKDGEWMKGMQIHYRRKK